MIIHGYIYISAMDECFLSFKFNCGGKKEKLSKAGSDRINSMIDSSKVYDDGKHGVLRYLKHIFPKTYQRIKSICSPAKVGLVVIDLITSPVVSWRGWETPPPPSTAAQLSFFA